MPLLLVLIYSIARPFTIPHAPSHVPRPAHDCDDSTTHSRHDYYSLSALCRYKQSLCLSLSSFSFLFVASCVCLSLSPSPFTSVYNFWSTSRSLRTFCARTAFLIVCQLVTYLTCFHTLVIVNEAPGCCPFHLTSTRPFIHSIISLPAFLPSLFVSALPSVHPKIRFSIYYLSRYNHCN